MSITLNKNQIPSFHYFSNNPHLSPPSDTRRLDQMEIKFDSLTESVNTLLSIFKSSHLNSSIPFFPVLLLLPLKHNHIRPHQTHPPSYLTILNIFNVSLHHIHTHKIKIKYNIKHNRQLYHPPPSHSYSPSSFSKSTIKLPLTSTFSGKTEDNPMSLLSFISGMDRYFKYANYDPTQWTLSTLRQCDSLICFYLV